MLVGWHYQVREQEAFDARRRDRMEFACRRGKTGAPKAPTAETSARRWQIQKAHREQCPGCGQGPATRAIKAQEGQGHKRRWPGTDFEARAARLRTEWRRRREQRLMEAGTWLTLSNPPPVYSYQKFRSSISIRGSLSFPIQVFNTLATVSAFYNI